MKHTHRRILAALLALGMLLSLLPAALAAEEHDCPGARFTDMPPVEHCAHAAIDWAVENGVVAGISETAFGPERYCTRAQMVTILWRAAGSPQPAKAECPFRDVSEGA